MSKEWNRRSGRTSSWITVKRRRAIYRRDEQRCVYCGMCDYLTLDHIVPRYLGGSHATSNLVTACRTCNSSRAHRPLSRRLLSYARAAACQEIQV